MLAPVALFAYNRPFHLKEVLNALSKNLDSDKTDLFIFLDGIADLNNSLLVSKCRQVEDIAKNAYGFKSIEVIKSDINKGCDQSEIDGITQIVDKYGKIIVLEDDLITSPYFLNYMNFCLDYYERIEEVGSINAFSFKIDGLPAYYFIKGGNPLGWATWSRAWKLFNPDGLALANIIESNEKTINDWEFGNSLRLLKTNQFWDVKWYASLYLNNKLGLFPSISYTNHIGFDGTGTHDNRANVDLLQYPIEKLNNQVDVCFIKKLKLEENLHAKKKLQAFYFRMNGLPYSYSDKIIKNYYLMKHQIKKLIMPDQV